MNLECSLGKDHEGSCWLDLICQHAGKPLEGFEWELECFMWAELKLGDKGGKGLNLGGQVEDYWRERLADWGLG